MGACIKNDQRAGSSIIVGSALCRSDEGPDARAACLRRSSVTIALVFAIHAISLTVTLVIPVPLPKIATGVYNVSATYTDVIHPIAADLVT